MKTSDTALIDAVRAAARPLARGAHEHDELLDLIGDAHIVLLGEASHGTHEFYRERARITQRLIAERGFHGVAVEADWPDAWRVNRYVRGRGSDTIASEALGGFKRFPTWMWRNRVVVDFVEWQRRWNREHPAAQTGFYGLDLYSLHNSIHAVLRYLEQADPAVAQRARERYACFDQFGDDSQVYGLMTGLGSTPPCDEEVIANLVELSRLGAEAGPDGGDADETFNAEQNARLVKNAESYYRSMYLSDVSSWNLRDEHMVETLAALEGHLARGLHGSARPKIVVWAHNSHLGDARATEMGRRRGERNVGQLVRERHGADAVLIGQLTHAGHVTAASDWDAPAEHKRVLPSRADSYEAVMHASGIARFMLPLRGRAEHIDALREPRLERAIGVIYRPETERQSHYFSATLPEQFDAVLHLDETHALHPLERNAEWHGVEAPETYPVGL